MARGRRRPRVLFLFTELYANGGIQRFNQTILEACGRLEIECRVLSLNDSPASVEDHRTGPAITVAGFSGSRRRFTLAAAATLLRRDYDRVLIGHVNLLTLFIGILSVVRYRPPQTLLIAHGIEVWSGLGRLRRFALSRTDRILCVSNYTKQRILEQAPTLAAERLVIFPNALADTWARAAPAAPTRTLPERFILSVTRLERGDRYKGIASVIEAFSMLADRSLEYLVVGHGNDLVFLEAIARRCGVADRVHFVRGVSDSELITLYERCEAFVLPSGKEGFGIVFLEAMFFGAPVIAADEKGAKDVVRDGDTGLTVRFGDTIGIKEAIERLASIPALRARLCAAGRATVIEGGPFTFDRFAERCAVNLGMDEPISA
jgi:glycosyltransferase involved in cell wall biosynthesis